MKPLDYIALALALALTAFSLVSALSIQSESLEILIQNENSEWIYPLDGDISQTFSGPIGETIVLIRDGSVLVTDSDCSEKICVQSGAIHHQGQWIACMPNRLFITIRGKQEAEVDGEAY